jgi:Cu+-exporting ATPase
VTAVLIVACPCSLLLSATFTYGNMLSLFGKKKLYLKNSSVIETLGKVDTIVLDKTGTITHHKSSLVYFEGETLNEQEKLRIKTITSHSTHPLSKMIAASLETEKTDRLAIEGYREISGKGLEGLINDEAIKIGSFDYVQEPESPHSPHSSYSPHSISGVHVKLGNRVRGRFLVSNDYRAGIGEMAASLKANGYDVHVLSGDNNQELDNLKNIFGQDLKVLFRQDPQDKLNYIRQLQDSGKKVMMLGDGLNDAGALRQADVGLAVTDATNLFSPASDGILDGSMVHKLDRLLQFGKTSKTIVTASFILSILYNIVGLSFATQALLSPMIAAILMPASSISIVAFVSIYARLAARKI